MSDLDVAITGYVVGDDLEIRRTVTDLPDDITTAWLTLKRYPALADAEAQMQKRITTADVPGVGQIVAAGALEVNGNLRFDLTKADTTALGVHTYAYDIQIKVGNGKVYTIEKGTIRLTADVTRTTT